MFLDNILDQSKELFLLWPFISKEADGRDSQTTCHCQYQQHDADGDTQQSFARTGGFWMRIVSAGCFFRRRVRFVVAGRIRLVFTGSSRFQRIDNLKSRIAVNLEGFWMKGLDILFVSLPVNIDYNSDYIIYTLLFYHNSHKMSTVLCTV